jgi:hypothetical protein
MIQLIQWPPVRYCSFSLLGRVFEQEPDEPFVTHLPDGSVDVDLVKQTPGFINRIQRFGLQNKIDHHLWDEQTIFFSLLPKMPLELREKFFKNVLSDFQTTHTRVMSARVHTAPVPPGTAAAAGFTGVADSDPDLPARLALFNADKWMSVLKKWMAADPDNRKTRTAAGPVFWYAIHTLAMNRDPAINPNRFVGLWIGAFPCRKCRIGARAYIARNPVPGWEHFPKWASDMHDYVTARKS